MGRIFLPAAALLGRLRYAHKILLVAVVPLIPLGLVTWGYVDIQRGQVAFSAAERDGVAYLRPLLDLTVRTVDARHLAVLGRDPSGAGVDRAVTAVNAVDARYGASLDTTDGWKAAKTALRDASEARGPVDALATYDKATAALINVINRVSDRSNLTLDPDLDSYYVMDTLVFRLPILLDTSGNAVDEVVVNRHGTAARVDATRIDLAIASGTLGTTSAAVGVGMATAFSRTASDNLKKSRPAVDAVLSAVGTMLGQVTNAVTNNTVTEIEDNTAEGTAAAGSALIEALGPALDELIATRIGGFQARAYKVEAAALAGALLVLYLLTGFYLSVMASLRRMVSALGALAQGDLTREVPIDTRDEVGRMAGAFNDALGRLRELVHALRGSADGVAGASGELTSVSRELRGTAERTATEAGGVSVTADQVSGNVATVASGTEEMSAAIHDIATGASEAATVAGQASTAVAASNEAVARLGNSSAEIGSVVRVITNIAGQINLLALNATIEAARAGEAGRGFAVVANEVKELSQESARATDDIIARVQAIQNDTMSAVEAIFEIGEVVDRISGIQTAIAAAVEEQTATTNEISRSVTEVATGSASIAESVAGVARSAEQTTASALVTERAADQLARTADELRRIVNGFRTA